MTENNWGRADASGNVFVRTADGERQVGAFPDVPAEEALAYFVRKYDDIALNVNLLERRATNPSATADVLKGLAAIRNAIESGVGVGDFDSLSTRVANLESKLAESKTELDEKREEAKREVASARTALVDQIEAIAVSKLENVNWKSTTAEVDALFERWQASQRSGVKISKGVADDLWKRFRNARSTIDRARRAHFATLDAETKTVKIRKEALIAQAEALVSSGGEKSVETYRQLLESWKSAGRASKKVDDVLWSRFKKAGDSLYQAKAKVIAAEDASFGGNLDVKLEILKDGQSLLGMKDRDQARAVLTGLQRRWEAAGKVPRANVKDVEASFRKLELAVKKLDDEAWSSSDPEKVARQTTLSEAIQTKIMKLEAELATATKNGDSTLISRLTSDISTQKSWLDVLPH